MGESAFLGADGAENSADRFFPARTKESNSIIIERNSQAVSSKRNSAN